MENVRSLNRDSALLRPRRSSHKCDLSDVRLYAKICGQGGADDGNYSVVDYRIRLFGRESLCCQRPCFERRDALLQAGDLLTQDIKRLWGFPVSPSI
jgi:hypothetical protein